MSCRCAELRAVFGAFAPTRCGPCSDARKVEELRRNGFLPLPLNKRVTLERLGLVAHVVGDFCYAPGWVARLNQALPICCDVLGSVLSACVRDPVFRRSVEAILATSPDPLLPLLRVCTAYGAVTLAELLEATSAKA